MKAFFILLSALFIIDSARANENVLREPPVLKSENGMLDLLMVARAEKLPLPLAPTGWIYDVCRRPEDGAQRCPAGQGSNPYGGTRLQLKQGDVLKIRLVNQLPPIKDSARAGEKGLGYLAANPTNLHTHGLLVSPRGPTHADPTYGDNVFVMTFNGRAPALGGHEHAHGTMRDDFTDYRIEIPKSHPSGLYWFHPHVHGISLNQISAGLAGLITIGDIGDYLCTKGDCEALRRDVAVRHLILKDTQILKDGTLLDEQESNFCKPPVGLAAGRGFCDGGKVKKEDGKIGDYSGGKWNFTVNGQTYPSIPINSGRGEIWRITNTSGNITYNLRLFEPSKQRKMIFQVLAVDGVSVGGPGGAGGKLRVVPCPGLTGKPGAVCVDEMLLMPSARAEVWVTYRDESGKPATPQGEARAVLQTTGFEAGANADHWPAVDLADVKFSPVRGPTSPIAADHLAVNAPADFTDPEAISNELLKANRAFSPESDCKPLPPGHSRRVFFGVPKDNPDAFGLGYEELDSKGKPVPGSFRDIKAFDAMAPAICLPLGAGGSAVKETWELINVSGEVHNFHMHQTKFRVIGGRKLAGRSIMHDSVPLPYARAKDKLSECKSVDDWRSGSCKAHPVKVEIPFFIAGDFVYHCHILEHEDGGMMALIRVRSSN